MVEEYQPIDNEYKLDDVWYQRIIDSLKRGSYNTYKDSDSYTVSMFSHGSTTRESNNNRPIYYVGYGDRFFPKWINDSYYIPKVLFIYGSLDLFRRLSYLYRVAIIGSRSIDSSSYRVTSDLLEFLPNVCNEVICITGGALGVDECVVERCLARSVLLIIIVPIMTERVFRYVVRGGENVACISLYPRSAPVKSGYFLDRNWIVSSIAEEVILIKGGLRSGSISCANYALKMGRLLYVNDLFNANDRGYGGNEELLQKGGLNFSLFYKKLANCSGSV